MRVLIADDNPTNRKLLRVVLEAEGAHVQEAGDGVEALRELRAHPVDVVVSDVLMPNKDGYELCYELRRDEKLRHLPFIFYTNTYTSASSEKMAYEFGADSFIKKPAAVETILSALREATTRRAKTRAAGGDAEYPPDLQGTAQYSRGLIDRLEQQNVELEATKASLLKVNHQLLERTKALEEAEYQLRRANDELEARVHARTRDLAEANRELDAFSYAAAHDLQAPLRAISGFAGILAERPGLDAEGARVVNVIRDSAGRMSALVFSLLELARTGRVNIAVQAVDLHDLAAAAMAELERLHPGRRVTTRLGPPMPAHGDATLLRVVLANLLGNAWKYTAGQPEPTVEFGVVDAAASPAVYFVRDNGVGFDMARARKLFTPFERLHSMEQFAGSGIGLATAARIVRRHRGKIWAESAPGQGATFFFTLGGEPAKA